MNIETSTANIKENILRYLDEALPVKKAMQEPIAQAFDHFQNGIGDYADNGLDFIKEPYLELATVYKEAAETLADLAQNGELEPEVARAFANYLLDTDNAQPEQVRLYTHQLGSLRSVNRGRNLVVCTGTGSGKTECFLLPIVNAIYKQRREAELQGEQYDEHVRALILYPMNALVNDQIRRLRKLLTYLPEITFGRYTSETDKKMSALRDAEGFSEIWHEGAEAGYMAVDGDVHADEDYLANEYRDRARWNNGGADILVTNFAMLERLLLLPNQILFNNPWDFIVLDEAHSYSGAAGTEIAWLVRRLRHRIDPDNAHDVRFLATSATLSTSADAETRERNTREFAASLFPAETDSFDIYSGEEEHFVAPANNNGNDTDIFNDAVGKLCADTVAFEARKTNHKLAEKRVNLLTQVKGHNGLVMLSQIDGLDSSLFQRHPEVIHGGVPVEGYEIIVSEEIRWLCKLMLTFSRDSEPYRAVLHDEMDGRRSEMPNDNNRLGNRLSLLEVWRNLANDNVPHPQTIHLETVLYLYRAIETLLQPEIRVEDAENLAHSIQNVKVHLTQHILDQIPGKITEYKEEEQELSEQESIIFQRWQGCLPGSNGENYREWIYNAIVARADVSRFFSAAEHPNSVSQVAADAGMNLTTMGRIIEVGAFAYPRGKRRPLIDVRFHQVVRDISHIGVYFRNGNPAQPVFVHSEDEYAETGEKIFGLGVCRRCGQPYLLGYGRDRHNGGGNNVINMALSRFSVGECKHLHAFTLNAPIDMDEDTKDREPGTYINLSTGNVVRDANPHHNETELYWIIGHDTERGEEFLSPCNACGGRAVATAEYGIITPYEATGIRFKIAVLEAFARETNPDPDAGVREVAPAGGRKILSFADSRSGAASLAFAFDRIIQTRYCDELVMRLRGDFEEIISREDAEVIARRHGICIEKLPEIARDPVLRQYMHDRDAIVQELILSARGENTFAQLVKGDHYERLLSIERDNGDMVDEMIVSKLRVLKALVASNRRIGLLPQEKLLVKSRMIEGLTRQNNLFNLLFDAPFENIAEEDMKAMLQHIYSYLVCSKRIQFDNDDDLRSAFYRWEPQDNFTRATIAPQVWRENHAVLRIVSRRLALLGLNNVTHQQVLNLLGGVWTIFERLLQANGNRYVFLFSRLCEDLIVEPGANFQENIAEENKILPLIIQEHTAQIDSKIGAVYQRAFSEGKINILSCSTTFEMGVDVGSLNNVFLGNMPPSTANYKQRAGRAGRRPGAAPWILTLCGSQSSYDRDRYEDPAKLFFGEIDPPRLYLDRPQFAARHFRAEALHKFLEWIRDNKWMSNNQDERAAARNWNKISYFLMGRISRRVQNQNAERFQAQPLPCTCCDWLWLSDWQDGNRDAVGDFVSGIYGYEEDFLANLPNKEGYSPVDDVVFQLKGMEGFFDKAGEPGLAYFRGLGGCNIPEMGDDGRLHVNNRPKWRSLNDRLEWKFRLLADGDDGMIDREIMNHDWPENRPLSLSQSKLLWGSTIDALSDACVLPRYGFPVDTINLVTQSNDGDAYGIELSRPIHLGMYEYAPGQSVYANKRRYESRGAKVYRFNNGDANLVANAQGESLRFCDSCHKVFYHREEMCPCCQIGTRNKTFVTPELFIANRGSINPPHGYNPPRRRIVSWSGQIRGQSLHAVEEMSLLVGEPTERAVHYVNTQIEGHDWYYLCEVPTNVVLWIPGFWNQERSFNGWESNRIANAFTSAMYALRKAMTGVLHINERDVGGLVQAYSTGDGKTSFWFVFFDADNGGGSGCVLDLLLRGADDVEGIARIRDIVKAAIDSLDGCQCGGQHDEAYKALRPVPPADYRGDNATRPATSCYRCLRTYDNQYEHDKLDLFDALVVLRLLLDGERNPPAAVTKSPREAGNRASDVVDVIDEIVWEPYDGHALAAGERCRLRDGTVFRYNPDVDAGKASDIEFTEQE